MRIEPEISVSVNCALKWIQVMRSLYERERRGEMNRTVYRHISHDLAQRLERLTHELLIPIKTTKNSLLRRIWGRIWGIWSIQTQIYAEMRLANIFGIEYKRGGEKIGETMGSKMLEKGSGFDS